MKTSLLLFLAVCCFKVSAQNYIAVGSIKQLYNLKENIKVPIQSLTNDTLYMVISIEAFVNNKWKTVVKDVDNDVYTTIIGTPVIRPKQKNTHTVYLKKAFRMYFKPPPYTNLHYDFDNSTKFRLKISNSTNEISQHSIGDKRSFLVYSNVFHIRK